MDAEIDLDVPDDSGRLMRSGARGRRWRLLVGLLVPLLIFAAWSIGEGMGERAAGAGMVAVAVPVLHNSGSQPGLHVTLVNFDGRPARLVGITSDGRSVAGARPLIPRGVTTVVAPLNCSGLVPPQVRIDVVSADGAPNQSGYLPSRDEWLAYCRSGALAQSESS